MSRYIYITFGEDVPTEIEKEYNCMCRQEQYQEEKDIAHGVVKLRYDSLLQCIADPTSTPEYQEELLREQQKQARLAILPAAMEWLRVEYPDDYTLIMNYYFSDRQVTLHHLAQKYGITKQAMHKRMTVIRNRLRDFIIMHENQD